MLEKASEQKHFFDLFVGGEGGPERTFEMIPVEKEILLGGVSSVRKMIGFRPNSKLSQLIQTH